MLLRHSGLHTTPSASAFSNSTATTGAATASKGADVRQGRMWHSSSTLMHRRCFSSVSNTALRFSHRPSELNGFSTALVLWGRRREHSENDSRARRPEDHFEGSTLWYRGHSPHDGFPT